MKNRICYNHLPVFFLLVSIMLNSVSIVQAQEITTYQYRHVAPDKAAEFIKRETTYWSKVAQKAIDNGKMSFWALMEKVGGTDMATASNYMFINSWPDVNADLSNVFNPSKLFPGIPMAKMSTDAISTVTADVFVINDGWQELAKINADKDYKYVLMNYHNSSNPNEFNRLEKTHWGPFIKAAMDNNQVDQKAWGNALVLTPTGGNMKFNCLSFDLYSNLKSALMPTWSPDINFPNAGLDSLQKISLDPPARVLYRIVKVVSKK